MLTSEDKEMIDSKIIQMGNNTLVTGFLPGILKGRNKYSLTDIEEYLESGVVERLGLKRQYVLYDENVVLIGRYDILEDVPQDTEVENAYGEEVYVGENWHHIQYNFDRDTNIKGGKQNE